VRDAEIVETELMLADLDSLEKRLPNLEKRAKGGDKEAAAEAPVVKKALDALREGKPAREAALTADEQPVFRGLQLITAKPMMYVLNVERLGCTRQRPCGGDLRQGRVVCRRCSRHRSRRGPRFRPTTRRNFPLRPKETVSRESCGRATSSSTW
jgi:hypothetical protein